LENKTFNEEDVRKFYNFFLHSRPTEIRVFDSEKYPQGKSIFVENRNEFVDECRKYTEEGVSVYIGARDRSARGDKNVVSSDFIFFEIDEHGENKDSEKQKILDFLQSKGIEVSMIGFSGGGWHFYIRHKKQEFESEEAAMNYKDASLGAFKQVLLNEGFDVDPAVFNLERVTRVLGTYNYKRDKISSIEIINDYVDIEKNTKNLISMVQSLGVIKSKKNDIVYNSEDDEFIKSIKEKWIEGDRQNVAIHLAGYLRKEKRLGLESAINIVKSICDDIGDTDIQERIAGVRATYNKDEKDIKGITGLKEKNISAPGVVLMSKFSPVPFADEIMKHYTFVYDKNKIFWRYDDEVGLWKTGAEQFVRTVLRNKLMGDEQQKRNYIDEIISYIKDVTYKDDFEMNNNPYWIAFKNKAFDIKKGECIEFSPELYLTNKLDIEIDENIKECPVIDKFFTDCVGEDHKQILYDLCAYTLFKEMPYQKLFFVYGPAGTGKSKFLDFLEGVLGKDNYCSVEPKNIQKDIHATSQMLYKLANIVSDINYDEFDNINQVKKLTGGDTVTIRNMYKDPYNAKLFVKQIYSTNKMPVVKEKTRAWYRRVYPIEFSNIISAENRDPNIVEKLLNEKELKGFAYKCLEVLKDLYANKFTFSFDINEKEMGDIYEELSNPILMFINESCNVNNKEWVYKYEFEERLNNWLKNNHFPTHTKTQINQYMKEYYSESNRTSLHDVSKTYRVWTGLGWKSMKNDDISNGFNHFNHKIKKVYIYRKSFSDTPISVKSVKSNSPQETEVENAIL
jgi:putative DNA primase/helicase